MSTHATIAIINTDNTVSSIYCHFDGYVSYVGKILFENYANEGQVALLIGLGDISHLKENINEIDVYANGYIEFEDFNEFMISDHQEYTYIFEDGDWYVSRSDEEFIELSVALSKVQS